jgi:hypothetical protein
MTARAIARRAAKTAIPAIRPVLFVDPDEELEAAEEAVICELPDAEVVNVDSFEELVTVDIVVAGTTCPADVEESNSVDELESTVGEVKLDVTGVCHMGVVVGLVSAEPEFGDDVGDVVPNSVNTVS